VLGKGMDPRDMANPWAVFDNYTDRVMVQCVNVRIPGDGDQRSEVMAITIPK